MIYRDPDLYFFNWYEVEVSPLKCDLIANLKKSIIRILWWSFFDTFYDPSFEVSGHESRGFLYR